MIKTELISNAINYFQRINYSLKTYVAKRNYNVGSPFAKGRINSLNFYQTVSLFEKVELDEIFNSKDKETFKNLTKYFKFVTEKCYLEFHYDLESLVYHKKVDYVNAKLEFICNEMMVFCHKLEGIVFEKNMLEKNK